MKAYFLAFAVGMAAVSHAAARAIPEDNLAYPVLITLKSGSSISYGLASRIQNNNEVKGER